MINIKSKDENSYIKLELLETELINFPSFLINCSIKNGNYMAIDKIWIELPEYNIFFEAFKTLNKKREGIASITSMSPEELNITIKTLETNGPFQLHFNMSKVTYNPNLIKLSLSGGFELDSEFINTYENELLDFNKKIIEKF